MFRLLLTLVAAFVLSGCSELEFGSYLAKRMWPGEESGGTVTPTKGTFKVGKPYQVQGQWYYPKEQYDYEETGIASWYGPGFHGKRTASGEVFDQSELTAAHRTLQMPSLVRVTNLDNGRSIIVRVNDRGPYKRGRVIDLSKKSAELLGFQNIGTAKVKLQLLGPESREIAQVAQSGKSTKGYELAMNGGGKAAPMPESSPPSYYETASLAPAPEAVTTEALPAGHVSHGAFYPDPIVTQYPVTPTGIYIQAGSFTVYDNAVHMRERLQAYKNAEVHPATINGRQFFRVRLGPIVTVDAADTLLSRLVKEGFGQSIIVVE